MTPYTAPKAILEHPGVAQCDSGHDGGSDYKHDVLLKDGWQFKRGRMAGGRCGFFRSVKTFLEAQPMKQEN